MCVKSNSKLICDDIYLMIFIYFCNKSLRNKLIEEEYVDYSQQPVKIKIEEQFETNTENPLNHTL